MGFSLRSICSPNGERKWAYRPLARFLRRPETYRILGDAVAETVHRVMASVFDGDPGPIYDIINDPEADEFVRRGVIGALVILVLRGELDRDEVAKFLQSSFTDLQPQGPCAVWIGWQGAVAALGLTELRPLVRKASSVISSTKVTWISKSSRPTSNGPAPATAGDAAALAS